MSLLLNEEINNCLELLNDRQKEAVLHVAKAFIEDEQDTESDEYSDELKEELDSQYLAYQKGELITFSEEEVRQKIKEDRYAEINK